MEQNAQFHIANSRWVNASSQKTIRIRSVLSTSNMATKKANKTYVLFGFNLEDDEVVGYFSNDLKLTDDIDKAKRFSSKKSKGQKGFGTPEQWCELINSDVDLNHGYRFHLVPIVI